MTVKATRDVGAQATIPSQVALTATLVLGIATYQFATTMVAPALPLISNTFGMSTAFLGLTQSFFFLVAALVEVAVPISDRFGRRNMLLACLGLAAVGHVVAALAPSGEVFFVGRLLQGMAGVAFPLAFITLHKYLSPAAFGQSLGVTTAVALGVTGIDTLAGGYLAEHVGFRVIFWFMAALTMLAVVFTWRVLPRHEERLTDTTDWAGIITLCLGVGAILFSVSQGGMWGWTHPGVLTMLIIGVVVLASFPWVEGRRDKPLVETALLRSRNVWPLLVLVLLSMGSFFTLYAFVLPLLTQSIAGGYGLEPFDATIRFIVPAAALSFVIAPVVGRLAPRIGWRRVCISSLIIATVAICVIASTPQNPLVVAVAIGVIGASFFGCTQTTMNALSVLLSPKTSPSFLPGTAGCCFALGVSIGIAAASAALSKGATIHGVSTATGYSYSLWLLAAMSIVAVIVALLVPKPTVTP